MTTQHPVFKLHNTLSKQIEPFEPIESGKVRLYVCGPTVYDHAHLGHARCYITWDVLVRFLKFLGYQVTYVRNVTDVDDKILNRAKQENCAPSSVATKYYASFKEDMASLNTLSPDVEPKATEYIDEMQLGIQKMIANNAAYVSKDGSVYFRTSAKSDYGKLSKKPLDELKAGARVEVDPNKESPLDFALWKGVPLSDADAWESPWPAEGESKGWGRPGWHMECSAMNHKVLGEQIDIHAGGADLIFPHHENEIAQTECWTGKAPFAKYWMHNGFVNVSGEKMSKSLGNFSTIKGILQGYDANTIRYFLLTNKYNMPVDFNDEALQSAENRMQKLHRIIKESGISDFSSISADEKNASGESFFDLISARLCDDLNTPRTLALMDESFNDHHNLASLRLGCLIFNLLGFNPKLALAQKELPAYELRTIHHELTGEWLAPDQDPEQYLQVILEMRQNAKAIKNWQQADAIRKHLSDIGIQIMDSKDGTTTYEVVSVVPQPSA